MNTDYDIIVVGSGMSGGYAAKEFCEKGYKTLVLDRGEPLEHGQYKTEFLPPWSMEYRGRVPEDELATEQPIQRKSYALTDFTKHHFINDKDNPYQQDQPFTWIRSAKVGGKSLLWARQSYRWNALDFAANAQDGHGIDWPIRYNDIAPWYDYVEPFIGIAGSEEGLEVLPDGKFLPPLPMNTVEREIKAKLERAFPGRKLIPARVAHLTQPQPEHLALGRGMCMARNECQRGCSWGGYYSSLSGALAAAKKTNNMTLRANAQVQQVLYGEQSGRATGVAYVDTKTGKRIEVSARIIFMCASTLASVQILLNSRSAAFPNGIGNRSTVLGHYIMDHVGAVGARGDVPGHLDMYYKGRRPGGVYLPRFRNLETPRNDYLRGFGFQGSAERRDWRRGINQQGIGAELKQQLRSPGGWKFILAGYGEVLPDYNNKVYLHETLKDKWGMPQLVTDVAYGENAIKMKKDIQHSAAEMLTAAGLNNVESFDYNVSPGGFVHEMGGACMGKDPKTSYLNQWNQSHEVSNLFVTDGAAFSSISCVNPSITFMALTARAADYAVKQMKTGNL
ncbi:GMC oxidoreductase [Planctobacterium marinum]|uniref:GMC oxidoreductase n=1 Tax=Planctobacterium marinum TaxID=1631968 RepID=UPI001E383EAC|nr:GMC family oxidoreductase [Planctobacterium marinum]MCC2606547.1 GMC family oxidoreductase [Planctobacterium marinum]